MVSAFGDRLRQSRLSEGLSQDELANKLDVAQPTISTWERGAAQPGPKQLSKLEEILGKLLSAKDRSHDDSDFVGGLPSNAFGVWLRRARGNAKMSVPELAKSAGISSVAIYNIESGKSINPQAETKASLERALKSKIPEEVRKEIVDEQEIKGVGTLTDFDPHDEKSLPKAPGVYVFYDVSERPIYIGKSDNISRRVKDHSDKFWFKRPIVDSASYVEIKDQSMRHSVEQVLIKFLKSNAVINKQSVDR
jgi:transcriptional regulator with XRE-family HTH domain